mmetsp:Transcript_13791/g.20493  ORF Transcript_13791/g.20493 Transcript_13791/m.20493 type:complete len:143 (+) Transcript_13791:1-429(+)
MLVNGKTTSSTPDAFWVVDDGSGKLGCGPKVTVKFSSGRTVEKCLPGSLFGSGCSSGEKCIAESTSNDSPSANNDKAEVAGSRCENGIPHVDGKACCPKSCGKCGGPKCSILPGGAGKCCGSQIKARNDRSCENNPAPCIMP